MPLAEPPARRLEYLDLVWDFSPSPDGSAKGQFLLRVLGAEEEYYGPVDGEPPGDRYTVFLPTRTTTRKGAALPLDRFQAREDGKALWSTLPAEVRKSVFHSKAESRPVRIKICGSSPRVTDLCWEFLGEGDGPDALGTADWVRLTRCVPIRFPTPPLTVPPPLRVLIVLTNPKDERLLDAYREIDAVQQRLVGPDYERILCPEATPDALRAALAKNPHVVHYIGHAGLNYSEGNLILHSPDNHTHWLSAAEVARLLPSSVRLLCLSTCFTAPNYQLLGLPRFANVSSEFSLPTTIANQYPVAEVSVRAFWSEFYSALIEHGGNVNEATHRARRKVAVAGRPADWASWQLVIRDQSGQSLRVNRSDNGGGLESMTAGGRSTFELQAQHATMLANDLADQVRLMGADVPPILQKHLQMATLRLEDINRRLESEN